MKTIPLTKGQFAIVDDEDYENLSKFKWCAQKRVHGFHAARYTRKSEAAGPSKYIYMHTFLLPGIGPIDHRDGNGLNNQRSNLRAATKRQNGQAKREKRENVTSVYRGVVLRTWVGRGAIRRKWQARICVDGVETCLGFFEKEIEAAKAYDTAAREYFGEFAAPNFP